MAAQNLGNETTTMIADGADLIMGRIFDAPRELVWAAMTSPEHVPNWWGPRGSTTVVVEMDVRPGGKWRWLSSVDADGVGAPFKGEYLEVDAPERLVRTITLDVEPFNTMPSAVETITLEEVHGKTKMSYLTRFPAEEILQGQLANGMTKGSIEQFDRLAELVAQHLAEV